MTQGKSKGLQAKARSSRKVTKNMKKGQRTIAPKRAAVIQQANLRKELSAKINRSIETQMVTAASSGKLTILKHSGAESNQTKS